MYLYLSRLLLQNIKPIWYLYELLSAAAIRVTIVEIESLCITLSSSFLGSLWFRRRLWGHWVLESGIGIYHGQLSSKSRLLSSIQESWRFLHSSPSTSTYIHTHTHTQHIPYNIEEIEMHSMDIWTEMRYLFEENCLQPHSTASATQKYEWSSIFRCTA